MLDHFYDNLWNYQFYEIGKELYDNIWWLLFVNSDNRSLRVFNERFLLSDSLYFKRWLSYSMGLITKKKL